MTLIDDRLDTTTPEVEPDPDTEPDPESIPDPEVEPEEAVVPGVTGVLRRMSGRGDTPIKWRVGNRTEEEIARAAFDKAKQRGWLAYRVDPDDHTKGIQMREFDPKAGEVILAPAPVGG